jgi:hypothetical protein
MARGMTLPIVMLGAAPEKPTARGLEYSVHYPILDLTGAVWFERSGFGVGGCDLFGKFLEWENARRLNDETNR